VSARATAFLTELRAAVSGEVREAEPLSRYSTYRIGGPATMLFPKAVEDIERAVSLATSRGVAWFALGLGSNVLLPDEGLDALVIRLGKGLDAIKSDGDRWTLGAGLPAPIAARRTAESGWSGLHKMVGVPGSVGGGVFMNAGCHGAEWSDVIETVTVVDWDGTVRERSRDEILFSYRRSGLTGSIVIETRVRLQPETAARLTEEVNDLFRWRQEGTPFNRPCCGSVFTNPAVLVAPNLRTAGQLVDAAGLKGFSIGAAQVSPMHANYIVNTGGATARQVREVIGEVRRTVRDRFGVELELEVKLVGGDGTVSAEP
jgi:UDP-N-acetylmuramate dehydrogenase